MTVPNSSTPRTPFSEDKWESLAQVVLPVIVAEEDKTGKQTHYYTGLSRGLQARHFPRGPLRDIYAAVVALRTDKKPVHFTTLLNVLGNDAYTGDVQMMFAGYDPAKSKLGGKVFEANLEELKHMGDMRMQMYAYENAARRTAAGEDAAEITSEAMATIAGSTAHTLEGETAEELSGNLTAHLESPPPPMMLTDVDVLDRWNDGVTAGEFMSIVAPM
jgi:hypothetical protein